MVFKIAFGLIGLLVLSACYPSINKMKVILAVVLFATAALTWVFLLRLFLDAEVTLKGLILLPAAFAFSIKGIIELCKLSKKKDFVRGG